MRKFVAVPVVVIMLMLCSCKEEAKKVSREGNALTAKFVQLMDTGKTTREQEQEFIRACSRVVYEVDAALRSREKADATRGMALAKVVDLDNE